MTAVQELRGAGRPAPAKSATGRAGRGARRLLGTPAVDTVRTAVLWAVLTMAGVAPAVAQVVRVEDESGTIYYTNEPCAPLYRRLVPDACRPAAEPGASAAAAAAVPAGPVAGEIERTATRYGVDRRLVAAMVQVESGGNPQAVSPKGALGLMQLMPGRAAALGVAEPFDPRANLDGGVRHLRDLLARYAGNLTLALAAYNAGEDAVRVHGGVPPYRETQEYVRRVLALYGPADVPPVSPPTRRPPARSRL